MSDALDRLFATIAARKGADPASSYTAKLLAEGVEKCAKKFGEEATETVIAAISRDKTELAKESADVLYHLAVLWAASGITPEEVYAVLRAREGQSGLEEKAAAQGLRRFCFFFLGKTLHQVEHALAHLGVLDLHECQRELQTLAAGYEFEHWRRHFRIAESGRIAHAFIKEIHRHIEDARHFVKAAGADAIDAFLVFLDLLKGEAEQIAQLFLTHSNQHAPDAHAIADLNVDGIGLLLWHGARCFGRRGTCPIYRSAQTFNFAKSRQMTRRANQKLRTIALTIKKTTIQSPSWV